MSVSIYNLLETKRISFLFLLENTATKKNQPLVYLDHQNVIYLCSLLCLAAVNIGTLRKLSGGVG